MRIQLTSLVSLCLAVVACSSEEKAAAPQAPAAPPAAAAPAPAAAPAEGAAPSADDVKAATDIFSSRCTPCHGPQGAGDGPASAGLTPKPANFTAAEWQAAVTDEHIEKIIMYGGPAVGKSAAMPPNPDLAAKPGVVQAMRAHIRALKK